MDWELFQLLSFYQQNHLHVFLRLDVVSSEAVVPCVPCHFIIQRIRLNRNSFQYESIIAPNTRHNHSFQIPANDKRWGMNRKILPHCLLINLTETSNSTYILVFADIIRKYLISKSEIHRVQTIVYEQIFLHCISMLRKTIVTFSCFNKAKNAFCL